MPRPTVIAMRAAKKDISSLSTQGLAANSLVLFCHYCTKRLDSETARNHHVSATPYCREAERNEFNRDRKKRRFNSQSESNTLPDPKCQVRDSRKNDNQPLINTRTTLGFFANPL
jgi:hypothetical protein